MNEQGKTFSIGENGINPLGILPVPQNIWPKDPEDIQLFLTYVYKSIALMSELQRVNC